ncbi:hypothetical protein ACP70R_021920 [Stipagrostis hirtigluma subsp. patula]
MFYFHGRRDADFCVISDRDLHINAHFIGKRRGGGVGASWTSAAVPALSVTRTTAANAVARGQARRRPPLYVIIDGRFSVMATAMPITAEESRAHRYGVTPDDCLAHLDLAFKFDALTGDMHGVVGQTYRPDYVNRFDVKASMPTMGDEHN